jgi:hypothetical protein
MVARIGPSTLARDRRLSATFVEDSMSIAVLAEQPPAGKRPRHGVPPASPCSCCTAVTTILLALLAFTPLAERWFGTVAGLDDRLRIMAAGALWIALPRVVGGRCEHFGFGPSRPPLRAVLTEQPPAGKRAPSAPSAPS